MMRSDVSADADRYSPPPAWDANASLAEALERAKEELELVSYVASHDLQAPLRAILGSCEALSAHPSVTSDKAAQALAQKITGETQHMKVLMQGLLDYLRLETFGPTQSLLDSNEIMETALSILGEKIQETGAKITHDTLPEVYGHRGRLTRLFVSLLDNALKFRSALPAIHVSAHRIATGVEFCFADNGIGIDEEYHEIVFGLFQRLHTDDAYPGDGIGLAHCRKIVESHRGKIWVESAPGQGSRFRFTLPVSKPDT